MQIEEKIIILAGAALGIGKALLDHLSCHHTQILAVDINNFHPRAIEPDCIERISL